MNKNTLSTTHQLLTDDTCFDVWTISIDDSMGISHHYKVKISDLASIDLVRRAIAYGLETFKLVEPK